MEITLSQMLMNNISSFFHLCTHENIKCDPVQRYYRNIEELLKILKSVLDVMADVEFTSDEKLQVAFAGLGQSVAELLELFDACQLLMSKVYFVLQVESLTVIIKTSVLEFFELLKLCDQRTELSNASVKIYAHKVEHLDIEPTSAIIMQAIKDQMDGSGAKSEDLVKIATRLSLNSNQELLIEAVALERLKENVEQAEDNGGAECFDQVILLVTHMLDRLVLMKQSQNYSPVSIPSDFCCPLSLDLMIDPVIVASGKTYERAFIRNWIDLGLAVCPKTRQTLAHTNLIPNYTMKAVIANWCETHNVKLPDPSKPVSLNQPALFLACAESGTTKDTIAKPQPQSRTDHSASTDSNRSLSSHGIDDKELPPAHHRSSHAETFPVVDGTQHGYRQTNDADRSRKCATSLSRANDTTFSERLERLEQGQTHLNTQVSYAIQLLQSLHTAQGLPIPPPAP